ncbi:unnamed protein product [Somion occarium]|uniref:Uncharacterized protein n=1 Tax=Somion occarium TaxID=3059160 RepID=A0ABP1E1H3_9APHY
MRTKATFSVILGHLVQGPFVARFCRALFSFFFLCFRSRITLFLARSFSPPAPAPAIPPTCSLFCLFVCVLDVFVSRNFLSPPLFPLSPLFNFRCAICHSVLYHLLSLGFDFHLSLVSTFPPIERFPASYHLQVKVPVTVPTSHFPFHSCPIAFSSFKLCVLLNIFRSPFYLHAGPAIHFHRRYMPSPLPSYTYTLSFSCMWFCMACTLFLVS